jgi:serine/threonine-protein kinase
MLKDCPRCERVLPGEMAFCPHDGAPLGVVDPAHPRAAGLRAYAARVTRSSGAVLDGRWQIHGFINKGATARVYLAEDLTNRQLVAVKMFAPYVQPQREADPHHVAVIRERFLDEAWALGRIVHPNVVRILDIGEQHGAPYLVMEALRGETLGDRLARAGTLDVPTSLRVTREIAAGLAAAHEARVIHRDVKPDNVFLIGDDATVKVIDFGMAKMLRSGANVEEELVMGTAQYMAPEQIVSDPADARTDVYALGVVLFKMLTGHLPFDVDGGLHLDLLGHHLFSPAPPPSWLHDHLDPAIERAILSAMRKEPQNRDPSMQAFHDDLSRARPEGWPLATARDVYVPATAEGRAAVDMLFRRFSLPPPPPPKSS